MAGREDSKHRKRLSASEVERAERVLHLAWLSLPPAHRALLESIGASQWKAVEERLGVSVDGFYDLLGIVRSRAQPILGWTTPSPFGSRIYALSS